MNAAELGLAGDRAVEIAALIERLHDTSRRLEELTAGEVDAVASHDGQTLLLGRAQEQLREGHLTRQAAIIDALPANIALVDAHGLILSVNEAWRAFASANGYEGDGFGVGVDYFAVCKAAGGPGSAEAKAAAAGLHSVLEGVSDSFVIEYPCDSPRTPRWFRLTATPLAPGEVKGAVLMHVDITAARLASEALVASELRFRQMADNIADVFFLRDIASQRMLYVSPAYEGIWGATVESLYADPKSWLAAVHPEDRAAAASGAMDGMTKETFQIEYRVVRPDGTVRWLESRGYPVRDAAGVAVRVAGVVKDVTQFRRGLMELAASERRFGNLLANVDLAAVMLDGKGEITYCNEYLLRLTGWSLLEVVGRSWFEVFMPGDVVGDVRPAFQDLLAGDPSVLHREAELVTRSGERRCIRWSNSVLRSGTGEAIGSASIGEDVTDHRNAQARLRRVNRVHAVLGAINGLVIRNRDRDELLAEACRIAVENGAFGMAWIGLVEPGASEGRVVASYGAQQDYLQQVRLTGSQGLPHSLRPECRALHQMFPAIVNDIELEPGLDMALTLHEAGHRSFGCFPLISEGRARGVLCLFARTAGQFDEEESGMLVELAGNISFALGNLETAARLDYLAYHDVLTGLANRAQFVGRLAQWMRSATMGDHKLALYLLDIERFKGINDTLGQAAGDALLRQVARWLTIEAGDEQLLARVGADEFAVVIPEMRNAEDVARHLDRAMAAFSEHPFLLSESVFRISARVGVAIYPEDGTTAESLFRHAESAVKKAKASGEPYLFYNQKMTALVAGRLSLENRLRQALDREEFVLHYQPKLTLSSRAITGVEALIRWNDPTTGLVPPGDFIPVLEETGLIHDVGRWALRQAVADYLRWCSTGLAAVRIAVNVSPLQLRNRGFISEVRQAIGIDAHAARGLELEITESVIMQDAELSISSLEAVREMGVTVAIDDFGTGYSSLSYLSKLPVDTLKIDRVFVVDIVKSEGLALVSTIVTLGHSLGLKVVAEGVETEQEAQRLSSLHCDEVQGYLFSRPLPAAMLESKFLSPARA